MAKILIINTGGTISMSADQTTGKVAPTDKNALDSKTSIFQQYADVTVSDIMQLPSPFMTGERMLELRDYILSQYEQYDGIVITHGTDTLEETAYFLELTLDLPIPVVVTGAMRSINEMGSDGLANLRSAIFAASAKESRGKGVLVVMNEEIHSATYVTKTHTTNLATFKTPTFGPLGLISKNQVIYFQELLRSEHYSVTSLDKKVALVKAYAGMEKDILEAILHNDYAGVVIEGLGAGNLPPAVVPTLEELLKKIPVIMVSRAFNGVTEDVYDYYGGGKQLHQMGVIYTLGLSGIKARIKLMILLNAKEKVDVKEAFRHEVG
ncbi:asparaginase [Atopobacter sp. AH10]|uniref:asparaginase n=1 Tax=Atopobacter sp. AH10 TaxID=2315861 RepID=UPI000EF27016|nr:asparaginase [Atopobacter sp. AH10]RLK63273.1 asparaginase [Atopobacter sp. AH10]